MVELKHTKWLDSHETWDSRVSGSRISNSKCEFGNSKFRNENAKSEWICMTLDTRRFLRSLITKLKSKLKNSKCRIQNDGIFKFGFQIQNQWPQKPSSIKFHQNKIFFLLTSFCICHCLSSNLNIRLEISDPQTPQVSSFTRIKSFFAF